MTTGLNKQEAIELIRARWQSWATDGIKQATWNEYHLATCGFGGLLLERAETNPLSYDAALEVAKLCYQRGETLPVKLLDFAA